MCSQRKLKILCIHGYRQTGDIFRQKIGALRKFLKKYAEFTFVTAPNEVPPINRDEAPPGDSSDQCGWWFSTPSNIFDSKQYSEVCPGFEESLVVIETTWKESGPFDGLLGFSQGATFVSILCGMQQRKLLDFSFQFAVMVAGFKSLCKPHDEHYTETVLIPTLHVFGESDKVIPKERSIQLTKHFKDPVVLEHPGGHFVPAADAQKQTYISFFESVHNIETR
ncbi:esterase OVCA2 [Anabrus simplex]|uniref:esterase OVCA2 n=1 Tax=Anabrus simplex TaxID=316456 RepID=UPI0035A2B769